MTMTDAELARIKRSAEKTYGTSCSQIFCKAGHGHREIYIPPDVKPERCNDGYMIAVQVFVADEED